MTNDIILEARGITKEFKGFIAVNNVRNTRAPLFPSDSGLPGLFYPTLGFYDDMGRYYTLGLRANF